MKKTPGKLVNLLCFCIALMIFGVIAANAQQENHKTSGVRKSVLEIIRAKQGNSPLIILSPREVSALKAAQPEGSDPCLNSVPIAVGEIKYGNLNQSDCRLDDNSYADFYTFNGAQGQQVPIHLSSTAFDAYLGVANASGTYVVEDDDSGGGTNSRIIATLPETGTYIILANTALPNQFGEYTLSLSPTPYCSYSINPTSAEVSPSGGTFTFSVTAPRGCSWQAYVQPSYFISTNSTGNGSGTATYTVEPNGTTPRSGRITIVPGYSPVPIPNLIFTVNQPPLNCTYSISQTNIALSPIRYEGTFNITAPDGCYWSARPNAWFISTNSEGRGNGVINYLVVNNNGADRVGTLTVAGMTFTVSQTGLNCTYAVSPTSITIDRNRQNGTLTVITQPNCTWSFFVESWVSIAQAGSGSGTATFLAFENPYPVSRTQTISFNVDGAPGSRYIQITQTSINNRKKFSDFDGDGKTDISVFRPSNGEWWLNRSTDNSTIAARFGTASDKIVPGDFTGDGKSDIAFFRPATGEWFVLRSEDFSFFSFPFGQAGDIPAPGDYDGDGRTDAAVFRPSTGVWYVQKSSGGTTFTTFGLPDDKPVTADYDGDGRSDIAIFRPSAGQWWYLKSSDGQVYAARFGEPTDKPVQGDYTGDGKTDFAFFRPADGFWYVLRSENGSFFSFPFGQAGDIPAPGDYDGDGKFDAAVFRPSEASWFVNRTSAGILITSFGLSGDTPVPSAFVP